MTARIPLTPLTAAAFAPFGEVLEASGPPDRVINQGNCGRFHDLATLVAEGGGRIGVNLFDALPRALPYTLDMVERHPLGSQAFLPMHPHPWLVIVTPDEGGIPGRPQAFRAAPGQGINFAPGTWHGVLTPLAAPGLFAVVDRIAPDGEDPAANLEEHWFDEPFIIER